MEIADLNIRYAASGSACPMTGELSETEQKTCKTVASTENVEALDEKFRQKSQLLFSSVTYPQGGKYICVATQNEVLRSVSLSHFEKHFHK